MHFLLDRSAEQLKATLDEAAQQCVNEMELRLKVEPVIRHLLDRLYGIDLWQIKSERRTGPRGAKYDTRYGGVVVEYEWKMRTPSRKRQAAKQALEYFISERFQSKLTNIEVFSAVICDGVEWGFLLADENLTGDPTLISSQNQSDRFVWYENSVQACRRFLQLVGSHPKVPVTGTALVETFGSRSPLSQRVVHLLLEAVRGRQSRDRADTMYQEWRRSLEVAYGDLDEENGSLIDTVREEYNLAHRGPLGDYLFAIHTYFALVTRLIAVETVAISLGSEASRPANWAGLDDDSLYQRIYHLETGDLLPELRISNLFEGDVFSWYRDMIRHSVDFSNSVRDICSALDRFAFPQIAFGSGNNVDFLRDLYQGMTPRPLRKALGEFPTPHWLAQATLEFAQEKGADLERDRILDPTCGTGSFLTPLVSKRLQPLHRSPDVTASEIQRVLNTVAGIDINPIAVIAARLNFVMALGDLAAKGSLHIPVWLADSVLLPEPPRRQMTLLQHIVGANYLELETSLDKPFYMPVEFVSQVAISQLTKLVRNHVHDSSPVDAFIEDLDQTLGPRAPNPVVRDEDSWNNAVTVLRVLYEHLLSLHEEDRDEFWAPIIENRFAPLFLGRFDLIVGNPPWVSWNRLPDKWRSKAEDVWRLYGLWDPPREPGGPRRVPNQISDIAVLVTAVALDRYLNDGGILAFVMPKSVIQADPGNRAFRQYHLRSPIQGEIRARNVDLPFAPLALHDFSEVQPFSPDAANSPIVLVLQRGETSTFPIDGTRWFRSAEGTRIRPETWGVVKKLDLRFDSVIWCPVSAAFPPSPLAWWSPGEPILQIGAAPTPYVFGKGIDTRGANGIYFLEALSPVMENGCLRVANRPQEGKKHVDPRIFSAEVEMLVPLIRGRDIKNFRPPIPSGYLLFPYESDRVTPINLRRLGQYPNTFDYLKRFKSVLIQRNHFQSFRPTEECWWQLDGGHHMNGKYLICVTEVVSKRPQCAVLTARWDDKLQRTILPVVGHKVTFCSTADELAAYFWCGMFNSGPVQTFLDRYANITALSPQALRRVPIPPFDATDPIHRRVAELARDAHRASDEEMPEFHSQISDLVGFSLGIQNVSPEARRVAIGKQFPDPRD